MIKYLIELHFLTPTVAAYCLRQYHKNIRLNMKTAVAHTIKSLTSKLHPPLPVSTRESQRLLTLLNASFKHQLNRQHSADSSSNEHYANLHLQSILTNPLFNAKPPRPASSSDKSKSQSSGKRLGLLQNHMEQPMDAFKERVSQGTADLGTAKLFLAIQYKACLASPAATLREAMKSCGAASTMLQWLWSSGMEDTGAFLEDREFVDHLVRFIIAEGKRSHILGWLYRCHSPEEPPFSSLHGLDTYHIQGIQGNLFKRLIREEIQIGDGFESAITLFLRTVAFLRNSGSTKSSMRYGAVAAAWTLITTIIHLPEAAKPKPSIIRCFLRMMTGYSYDPLFNAYLCVYLQKQPDPQPVLTYFQSDFAKAMEEVKPRRRLRTLFLGLRAAELFLQHGRQTEALWIMDYLQTNFAQELGSPVARIRKQSSLHEPEEESLFLLDTLAVQ